jgi:hypothetical protein
MNEESKEISSNLTLSDMRVINSIIDHVASKGVFKAADYTIIGSIYDKIASLLKATDEQSK